MGLRASIARAFAPDGALARCVDTFSPRAGQLAMADAVAATLETGGTLVVEAGTGVGKTFAYLVPALLSGQRLLLSTATKTLQDQLHGRDIPRLLTALGLPVRVALLKGRSSYLCPQRLASARHDLRAMHPLAQQDLAHIEAWSVATRSGDLAELTQLDEHSPVLPLVTSTRDNCLGVRCPQLQSCHLNQARRQAMAADVVVINHHLFFADTRVRESGVAELLPTVQAVVFDEAHQLNAIGVQFMGSHFGTAQLDSLCRDVTPFGSVLAWMDGAWRDLVADLGHHSVALRALCGAGVKAGRLVWTEDAPVGVQLERWQAVIEALQVSLNALADLLLRLQDHSPDVQLLGERASRLLEVLRVFAIPMQPGNVRWIDVTGHQARLVQAPLDIAQAMRLQVGAVGELGDGKSWIFTSATLGLDASLAQFVQSCGLEGSHVLQVSSPFDYAQQAALYVPTDLPLPSDKGHSAGVAQLVAQGASVLGGQTLVLTTTLRAMRDIAQALREHFADEPRMQVLLQGEASKRELIERFRQSPTQGAVLVASVSFWEGVDVPGDALQLVVIDKLPFAPPDDPLLQARARHLQATGKSPFAHLHVPLAAIALKQGAGRLIRSETDRGILVVCDVRLVQKGYGRRILAALPAMRSIATPEQFAQALQALTTPSTKDSR